MTFKRLFSALLMVACIMVANASSDAKMDQFIDNLMARMTLQEKIGQLNLPVTGDIITVTTKTGNKTVTLDRGGVKTNIINRLVSGSTWLTLREGKNRFYLRGTGLQNLRVKIIHTNAYLGV